ncbi:MAG: prenyltransferase/squalene oxidase repeat-containing protein [Planctomycetota bacterium]
MMHRPSDPGTSSQRPRTAARRHAFAAALLALAPAALAQVPDVLPRGVTRETWTAIQNGLQYLSRSQSQEGSWRNAGGHGSYPTAMTGLAGMALVAAGSTPTRGKYWREVRKSMEYLIKAADPRTGIITEMATENRNMYGHGFSTLYLASVYGMEEDAVRQERLHGVLTRAVRLIERAQSGAGGWIYTPDSGGDEGSVTVTQVQALRACRMAGIVVDKRTIDRAVDYIKKCQNPDGGISYSLGSRGASRPAISAAGVAVLYNAGFYDDQPFVDKALQYVKRHINPTSDTTGHHYYTQLYFAQALYQNGGKDWDDYIAKMGRWLVQMQRKDGSWEGDGVGPVYGTAIALTILQLPYALAPIYQR